MNDASPRGTLARFLTIADAAEMLSVSVGRAYALVRSGELPAIRIGAHGQWRIERIVLESFIEAQYEEARRASLWNQSEFANVAELAFGEDHIRTSRS
jgi:excisionase family DNA binding protein